MALETWVTVRVSPSMSLSLPVRSPPVMATSVSSVPEAASSVATGASLTQVRSIVTCAISLPPLPSPTV